MERKGTYHEVYSSERTCKGINSIMAAKTFTDIKKELPIDEGKLVASWNEILKNVMNKIESQLGKEYQKNSEKGIAMINTLGAMVGAKVTDKKQAKNKLFLKFGDIEEVEEGAKYTNVHNKIKKIRNLKRKESEFIASIDPAVLGQVVKALAPMFEEIEEKADMTAISSWKKKIKKVKGLTKQQLQVLQGLPTPVITALINQVGMVVAGDENIQEDAAVDAANLKAKQTEEMERLKEKQVAEMEALKDRHARQTDAINLQKEKETVNKQIEAEREAARKAATNEEVLHENEKGLKNKAEKSGMPLGILKQVYNRGLAAYKTGHRPGATAPQWAMARVNSFITKGKGTWGKADKDLADKVRGKSEEIEEGGLWDNIRAKKARGEKMRPKGAKGAPTDDQIKRSQEDKEEQDRDVSKNKGTQPKKYYKGLDKETKQKRDAHFKQGKTGPAPGDEDEDGKPTKTKKSVHTKKFAKMYGEKLDANADAGDYIKDFRKSDAPQFKGKSDKKIRKMAIAAYLAKKGK